MLHIEYTLTVYWEILRVVNNFLLPRIIFIFSVVFYRILFPLNFVYLLHNILFKQEGFSDPPSVSSISRLLRGGRPGDDGKKDYTIDGILGGGEYTN